MQQNRKHTQSHDTRINFFLDLFSLDPEYSDCYYFTTVRAIYHLKHSQMFCLTSHIQQYNIYI